MADRMILFGLEEFTAKRKQAQLDLEAALRPAVRHAVDLGENTRGWDDLLDLVTRLYDETYYNETGERYRGLPSGFRRELRETLQKTSHRTEAAVDRIAIWLATAILSKVTVEGSIADPEELFLEWVTMHDPDVRNAHARTDGQVRPIGDKFDVDGTPMRHPGDSAAPIDLWINCRCTLHPVLASEALARGTAMTAATPEAPSPEAPAVTGVSWHGILAPEGVASGDGRMFAPNSLTNRDLPLPLTWQKASSDGHGGSVVVAKIEKIERVDNLMRASGHFIANPEAEEVIGLLGEFGKFGVSVDADDATMEIDEANEMVVFTAARIASASIVAIPAFAEAYVALGLWDEADATEPVDGEVEAPAPEDVAAAKKPFPKKKVDGEKDDPADPANPDTPPVDGEDPSTDEEDPKKKKKAKPPMYDGTAEALHLVAAVGHCAPSAWFANPHLDALTPMTVTNDGRVFGHLAGWSTCHIGFQDTCTAPPQSATNYAYFLTGEVALDDGTRTSVGPITLGGGHAGPRLGLRAAVEHYDSTSSVVADVTMGEDDHGIWYAGWVRPGVPDEQVTALRASALSGDWRKVGANLELVAALAVNTPGFPVPRTQVAASAQGQLSLVASGVVTADSKVNLNQSEVEAFADAVAAALEARVARRTRMAALAARMNGDV